MNSVYSIFGLTSSSLYITLFIIGFLFILGIFFLVFGTWFFVKFFWLPGRKAEYLQSIDFTTLALDLPKNNEQSPKAVEYIFDTLAGTLSGPNLYEKYWLGVHQLSFSMEIVSLEGYIQFLIHFPSRYRDVVEAAFYAQYPDVEIMEVEDYTSQLPSNFPHDDFNMWGSDLKLGEKNCYPIRTYPRFEHSLSQELKDPMASLLEVLSRLKKGEYGCLQWVITPTSDWWKKDSAQEIKKIIGEKTDGPKDIGYYLTYPFLSLMKFLGDTVVVNAEGSADNKTQNKKDEPNKIQYLTSGQKDIVQAIEEKMSKTGFLAKGRYIYVAKHQVFDKNRGVSAIMGAINQFNTLNLNYFSKVSTTTTSADYVRVNQRLAKKQTRVIKAFKKRIADQKFGNLPFVLNTEELATIYHFPQETVKAPLLKKIDSKKSEPPSTLPIDEEEEEGEEFEVAEPDKSKSKNKNFPQTRKEETSEQDSQEEDVEVVMPNKNDNLPDEENEDKKADDSDKKSNTNNEVAHRFPQTKNNKPGQAPDNLPF